MYKIDSKTTELRTEWYINYLANTVTSNGIKIKDYNLCDLEQNLASLGVSLKSLKVDINLNSSTQVLNYLKEHYSGDVSVQDCLTVSEIIELKKTSGDTLIDLLNRYNRVNGKYKILKGVYKHRTSTGYVYPTVRVTKSNRIMYTNPSILNIPKDILWDIVDVTSSKYALYSVDIKAQEPTIMFNLNNKDFLHKTGGIDVYSYIYKECMGKMPTPFERNDVKKLINLCNYGGGVQGAYKGCNVLDKESVDKILNYYNSTCNFKKFSSYCSRLASNRVSVVTNYFGNKLEVSGDVKARKRTIQNLLVQSVAADIMAMLVYNCVESIRSLGLEGKVQLYFSRIDELIFQVDKDCMNDYNIKDLLRSLFVHTVDDWFPFMVSVDKIK